MRQAIFTLIITALIGFSMLCHGCSSAYTGAIASDAVLSQANFKIIKTISGSAQVRYVLGAGGNKIEDGLYAQAKTNMLESNPLQPNQTLTNVTVDVKRKRGLFTSYVRVTITADVVEFIK